jgi:hypothetical protein
MGLKWMGPAACRGVMRNGYEILVGKLERNLGVNRIILKWMLHKLDAKVGTTLNCLRMLLL